MWSWWYSYSQVLKVLTCLYNLNYQNMKIKGKLLFYLSISLMMTHVFSASKALSQSIAYSTKTASAMFQPHATSNATEIVQPQPSPTGATTISAPTMASISPSAPPWPVPPCTSTISAKDSDSSTQYSCNKIDCQKDVLHLESQFCNPKRIVHHHLDWPASPRHGRHHSSHKPLRSQPNSQHHLHFSTNEK